MELCRQHNCIKCPSVRYSSKQAREYNQISALIGLIVFPAGDWLTFAAEIKMSILKV